ncbi:hypothetical protein BKA57DRAFT_10334 [Linnemannia elongata]|nr:hypothetical protein BKA57DRAFT_10334 [Linnemannia elongata]
MTLKESLEVLAAIVEWSLTLAVLSIKIPTCLQQRQRRLAMLVLACQMPILTKSNKRVLIGTEIVLGGKLNGKRLKRKTILTRVCCAHCLGC